MERQVPPQEAKVRSWGGGGLAKKGMNEEEAVFSVESALEQTYEWSDKYRPRKPRYGAGVDTVQFGSSI